MSARTRPSNLIYDVGENPALGPLLGLGLQHVFMLAVGFAFPVIVTDAIGGTAGEARIIITVGMAVAGIAVILQGLNKGPVGSGYLCPLLIGPAYLTASILAGKLGGLPLVFGMTAVAGLFEAAFSRLAPRMRAFFPSEVTGTIVLMVGISIIPFTMKRFFGIDSMHTVPDPTAAAIAVVTVIAMIGFTVWGKGKFRLFAMLIGLGFGYAISLVLGYFDADHVRELVDSSWISLPAIGTFGISFSTAMVVPFAVAALSSALKTMGDLTTCQKINDAAWKRPEMNSIGRGILACGASNVVGGLFGTMGHSPSSSNIGLSIASGATSRTISWAAGAILILLAFMPKFAAVFVIMPTPVMGAMLLFAVTFMILAGIQIMLSRMIDARKTFVIGISIILGLSADMIPGLYRDLPAAVQPVFQSSLPLATITAVILNLFFRIGISKTARLELTPGTDSSAKVFEFMQKQGGLWGAMPDVVVRAASAINEVLEAAGAIHSARGPMTATVSFDEFNLNVELAYEGTPMLMTDGRPTEDEIVSAPDGSARLSLFLLRRYADRVESHAKAGLCRIRLHYNH